MAKRKNLDPLKPSSTTKSGSPCGKGYISTGNPKLLPDYWYIKNFIYVSSDQSKKTHPSSIPNLNLCIHFFKVYPEILKFSSRIRFIHQGSDPNPVS